MAIQVCFCAPKPPEGGLGHTSFVLRPCVAANKQIPTKLVPPRLAKPAECAGLERNFDLRQQIIDALDQFADRMPVRSLPQILCGKMDIYLRARDHPMAQ